jgi:hypothetical protein
MTRCSSGFRKGNIKKAVEAVKAAGETVTRVEIGQDGKVIVIVGKPAEGTDNNKNEWDAKYGKT